MSFAIDHNKRQDTFFSRFKELPCQRVVAIALPFLSLNAKSSTVAAAGIGIYQTGVEVKHVIEVYSSKGLAASVRQSSQLWLVVSSTALTILFPLGQFVFSNGVLLIQHLTELSEHLKNREWKQSSLAAFQIAHQAVHVGSVYYGTPAWLALSLLSQAAYELHQTVEFISDAQGRKSEACAYLILAFIRLSKARNIYRELKTVPQTAEPRQSWPEKQLSQEEWNRLYRHDSLPENRNLEEILIQRGFSKQIQDIDFRKTRYLAKYSFKNITFNKCNFSEVYFSECSIENVTATSCLFNESRWIKTVVRNTMFKKCNLQSAAFANSSIDAVNFIDCNLALAYFNDSSIHKLSIVRGKLLEANFLHAKVDQSKLTDCDLTDALLLDAKQAFEIQGGTPHRMTRPVIALGWNFESPGTYTPLISKALRDNGAIPLHYNQSPPEITLGDLHEELCKALQTPFTSPQEILQRTQDGHEVPKIQRKAAVILKHSQGLVLPGGEDIEEVFYKKALHNRVDNRRSVLEFALISEAEKHKIPTLGICRGAQIINVFFGGTLKNVRGECGTQDIRVLNSPQAEWLQKIVPNGYFEGFSAHTQAADKIGRGLHVIIKREGVPKLLVSEDGTFIGSQFHPEYYLERPMSVDENKGIYRHFIAKAKTATKG